MKETGIIFNTEMVKALQEGRKTQTRRVMADQHDIVGFQEFRYVRQQEDKRSQDISEDYYALMKGNATRDFRVQYYRCPYGQVGDLLWVRETHYRWGRWVKNGLTKTGKQAWTFKSDTREICYIDEPPTHIFSNKARNTVGWFKRPSIFMPRWASRTTLELTEVRAELFRVENLSPQELEREGGNNALGILKELYDGKWVWVLSFKVVK